MEQYGNVLTCVPLKAKENEGRVTRLVMYEDGTKIDFQIATIDVLNLLINKPVLPDDYDNGYKVLLDKDHLTKKMQAPTHTAFITKKPSREDYAELMNDFWWDTTYVAKNLWRDELYYAKFSLDSDLRFNSLQKLIEWSIGLENNWQVRTNKYGRWFKQYLETKTWEELESTFAGASIEENWDALFKMADLFKRLSLKVGAELGYPYPTELENKIRAYLLKVKNTEK